MASVNGVLATDQRDFNSDGRPELLVISISGGKLQFELTGQKTERHSRLPVNQQIRALVIQSRESHTAEHRNAL